MWRIYRLPGSREVWHIDAGSGTQIYNVRGFNCLEGSRSVDIGGNNSPRAWIEVPGDVQLHIVNGEALFGSSGSFEHDEEGRRGNHQCVARRG